MAESRILFVYGFAQALNGFSREVERCKIYGQE